MRTVLCVVGARPNFMKMAPILRAFADFEPVLSARLLHTGQHYDADLNDRFFADLGMPPPDHHLEVGSGSHAKQTAAVMTRFEPILRAMQPAAVLVVGDVNSTLACALVAAKEGVPVVHVEAGLRSYDRSMPEEINRIITDQLSSLLFTTEREAAVNLGREGIDSSRVRFVGNVMIDSLEAGLAHAADPGALLASHGAASGTVQAGYAVLTLHRPSNVDDPETLERLLGAIVAVGDRLPVVFPVHPRTAPRLKDSPAARRLAAARVLQLPPLGYFEMLGLLRGARLVLTDSGGLQEESTALGVPCLTLRGNTERPVTVNEGTNTVVGTDPARILCGVDEVMATGGKRGRRPELWDGHAAPRIALALAEWLAGTRAGGRT